MINKSIFPGQLGQQMIERLYAILLLLTEKGSALLSSEPFKNRQSPEVLKAGLLIQLDLIEVDWYFLTHTVDA